jgi:hypothetical protein
MSAPDGRPNDHAEFMQRIGDSQTAAIVPGIVALFELVFPTRIRGCFLLGSAGEHTAVELSDIDLVVLFAGSCEGNEETRAHQVAATCGLLSPIRLDTMPQSEATLCIEDVQLKLGSILVAGEDVRPGVPLPAPAAHARYKHPLHPGSHVPSLTRSKGVRQSRQ